MKNLLVLYKLHKLLPFTYKLTGNDYLSYKPILILNKIVMERGHTDFTLK